jgi:signal peptidase II
MKFILYCLVILAELSIDQYSKFVIVRDFSLHQSIEIIKDFFSITYVQNFGAGFSILQNAKIFLSVISISVIVMLTYYFFENKKKKDYLNKTAYLLIIGGALGNLVDRLKQDFVVDFLDFKIFGYDFPVFNFADCFITVGCFILIIAILLEQKHAKN